MSKNGKTKTTPADELTSTLKWRLVNKPTLRDIKELFETGIVSKEEARQLLFNEVKEDTGEREKALKEQIEFLQEVIEKLSNRGINVWPSITYTPAYPVKYWYSAGSGMGIGTTTTTTGINNMYSYSAGSNTMSLNTGALSGGISGTTTTGTNITNINNA